MMNAAPIPITKRNRILIIDDEELLSWCMAFELQSLGYQVELANNLESGRRALQSFLPDLVICDQNFPEGKSLSMLSQWLEAHQSTQTILITAYTPPTAAEMANVGTGICLSKPFEIKVLVEIIDAICKRLP